MSTRANHVRLLLALPLATMLVFFVAPLAMTFLSSFMTDAGGITFARYAEIWLSAQYLDALLATLRISAIVTVVCIVVGYVLAYYIALQLKSRLAKRIAYVIVILPLFTSNVVRSFGFMVLLGRKGLVNDTLIQTGIIDSPLRLLYNELSVVIGLTYIALPFVVLAIVAALQNINRELLQASHDLGAGPIRTFVHVVLPITVPGLVGGAVLAFTMCVSAYVTPSVMFGGRGSVMSMVIYEQYMQSANFPFGAALAVTLTLTAILVISFQGFFLQRRLRWVKG